MDDHSRKTSNFWFGFVLGTSASAAALYFFGTKKGRENMRRFLELTEDLEGTIEDVVSSLGAENAAEFKTIMFNKMKSKQAQPSAKPAKKSSKRFELKGGKIVE